MSLERKSIILKIGTTSTTILQAGTGENIAVVSLLFGNINAIGDVTVTPALTKSGMSSINIVSALTISSGSAIQFYVGGKDSLFLESGDTLSAVASGEDDVVVTVSYVLEK